MLIFPQSWKLYKHNKYIYKKYVSQSKPSPDGDWTDSALHHCILIFESGKYLFTIDWDINWDCPAQQMPALIDFPQHISAVIAAPEWKCPSLSLFTITNMTLWINPKVSNMWHDKKG